MLGINRLLVSIKRFLKIENEFEPDLNSLKKETLLWIAEKCADKKFFFNNSILLKNAKFTENSAVLLDKT